MIALIIDYMGNCIIASPQNMINLMLVVEYYYRNIKRMHLIYGLSLLG